MFSHNFTVKYYPDFTIFGNALEFGVFSLQFSRQITIKY